MLDENEWAEIYPFLNKSAESVKSYREEHGAELKEALRQGFDEPALQYVTCAILCGVWPQD